jgi:hypothetical protein
VGVQASEREKNNAERRSEHVVERKGEKMETSGERAKANGTCKCQRKKYIGIRCMRALRRNRFLSKCKFEYALDNANG